MVGSRIKNFTDLFAWQEGNKLVLMTYKITKKYPREEIFVLVSQMRRCVISVTSNIAEGFSRKSKKEKSQFYYISLGSATELQNQLLVSHNLGYIDGEEFNRINEQIVQTQKLINGLIRSSVSHT